MAIDDRMLHTHREKNVYLQGQLAVLDALINSTNRNVPWIFRAFTIELLTETRARIYEVYKERYPESDLK